MNAGALASGTDHQLQHHFQDIELLYPRLRVVPALQLPIVSFLFSSCSLYVVLISKLATIGCGVRILVVISIGSANIDVIRVSIDVGVDGCIHVHLRIIDRD